MTRKVQSALVSLWGERVSLTGAALSHDVAVARLQVQARSQATLRAYARHLRALERWSELQGLPPWQVTTVESWLAAVQSFVGLSSLRQAYSAARCAWAATGRDADWLGVRSLLAGARVVAVQERGAGREAPALRWATVREACRKLLELGDPKALRDRSLLLFGWLGGMRSAEIIALREDDVRVSKLGVELVLRGTKGRADEVLVKALPRGAHVETDPCSAWLAWCAARPVELVADGRPAFCRVGRSGAGLGVNAITQVVRRAATLGGELDGLEPSAFSAHSLRSGLATELSARGVPVQEVAKAGHWRSLQSVVGYAARGRRFSDAPQLAIDY